MSFWTAARLVARRDFTERIHQRSFLISAGVTLLIVAAVAVLPSVIGGDDTDTYTVGAVGSQQRAAAQSAARVAPSLDAKIEVRSVSGAAAARQQVRSGDLDAALTGPRTAIYDDDLPGSLRQALTIGARQTASATTLRDRGLNAAQIQAALDPPPLRASPLSADDEDRDQRKLIALAAGFLLYGQLLTYGLWVAMGVVEEKSSRVIEILLSTLSARAMMAGKIIGMGLLGMLQMLATVVVGLAIALATGSLSAEAGDLLPAAVTLLWFPLGYALYASLYAASGALVSRQEDLQSATTPLTILIIAAFFLSFTANDDPGGGLATIASLVPFTAPLTMPARMVLGEASVPEVVVAIVLMIATTTLLVRLGARVYENGLLRTGKPIKLTQALRAQR